MDWIGLGKHTFTFSSSLFDVVSDILNSLTFMGYYNPLTNNASSLSFNNYSFSTNQYHWINSETNCTIKTVEYPTAEDGYRVDQIWGIIGFIIVMLPGIVAGIPFVIAQLYNRELCGAFFFMLASLSFPVAFLILQLVAIIKICFKSNIGSIYSWVIVMVTSVESSVESCCQLLLQLFTIIYGYETTTIQRVTIITSFFQMAKCSISLDIEKDLLFGEDGEELDEKRTLGFIKYLVEVLKRLPLYLSTITFRVMSLCLTMAYLRYFAIIPLTLLTIGIAALAWMRCQKMSGSWDWKMLQITGLVVSNYGSMTASTPYPSKEDVKEVEKFVVRSSILTFVHHSVVLSTIMVIGRYDPCYMEHWSSPEFQLPPKFERCFWVFAFTLVMGCFSIISILYRARSIASLNTNEQNLEDNKKKVEDILLQKVEDVPSRRRSF